MSGTVTLHIGWPKTGSTTLQLSLWQARAALAEAGILYPRDGKANSINQARSISDLMRRTGVPRADEDPVGRGYWDDLAAEVRRDPRSTILSNENLVRASTATVDALRACFEGRAVRVVVVTRPVSSWLTSWYQQQTKHGLLLTADEFLRPKIVDLMTGGGDLGWMDPSVLSQRWLPLLDRPENMVWVDLASHPRDAAIPTVMRALGVPDGIAPVVADANTSLSAAAVAGLQAFNRAHPGLSRRDRYFVVERTLRHQPWLTDRSVGGSIEVGEGLGMLLDRAFPAAPDHNRRGAPSGQARSELLQVLESGESLVRTVEIPDDLARDAQEVFESTHRRYRRRLAAYRLVTDRRLTAHAYYRVRRMTGGAP